MIDIFWIDENSSVLSLLKKIFSSHDMNIYFHETVKDIAYLVKDLNPILMIIDRETLLKGWDRFRAQYEEEASFKDLSYLIIGQASENEEDKKLDFILNKLEEIKKPFDPFILPEKVQHILSRLKTSV